MYSVSGNNWEETFVNKRIIDKVKNDHNFSEITSKIIISNKFSKLEIDSISKKLGLFNPFLRNNDFIKAHNLIEEAINKEKKIVIIGDYDVDGCISTSLLIKFFKLINKDVEFLIPNRTQDGYGANLKVVKKIYKKKPDLVIMVDCGSNAFESVNLLKSNKIKTLIIDHHEVYEPYPNADVIINPKKKCNYNEFNYFCSSTLTYFFIDFYLRKKKMKFNFESNLIFVLLATVCDVMPLRNLNRIIALNVLNNVSINKNDLFKKIFEIYKIKKPLEIDDFGFLVGPILNAAGRLHDANIVVDLIINKDSIIQNKILNKLIDLNVKRKKIENILLKEIDLNLIKRSSDDVLIEYTKILHEGLIGILASKLKEFFNKPSIVMTKSGNFYKASARSTLEFNISKHIRKAIDRKIILNGGGHNLAAGFTIKKNKIDQFKKFINSTYKKNEINKKKKYLSKISANSLNLQFYENIKILAPFGQGNENPIFLLENVKIIKPKVIKDKFLNFFVKSKNGKLISGISFSYLESEISKQLMYNKNQISLVVQLKENLWNNKKNIQLVVLDLITHLNNA